MARRWRDCLQVHPAAEVFPLLSKPALHELAADIKQHGLRQKVLTYRDIRSGEEWLLDGRNRLDALELIGIEVVNEDGTVKKEFFGGGPMGGDPVAWVVSANIYRRHLTGKQKRELIALLLKQTPERSNNSTAELVGASHHTVAKVRDELEEAGDVGKLPTRADSTGRQQPARKSRAEAPKTVSQGDLQELVFGLLDGFAASLASSGRGSVRVKTTVTFEDGTTIERTTTR